MVYMFRTAEREMYSRTELYFSDWILKIKFLFLLKKVKFISEF